jgi:hypothetical protein
MRRTRLTCLTAMFLTVPMLVLAQLRPRPPAPTLPPGVAADGTALAGATPAWGVADATMVQALSFSFRPQSSSGPTYGAYWDSAYMFAETGAATYLFYAPISLPAGASITAVGLDWYDVSAAQDITYGLFCLHPDRTLEYLAWYYYPTSAGYMSTTTSITPHTVDHANYYALVIQTNVNGQDIAFKGMRVYYKLQVSPAPVTATFGDVPTNHWAFRFVEALYASGITAGCGGGNFCPDQPLTRAQMAVFLSAALGLHFPN